MSCPQFFTTFHTNCRNLALIGAKFGERFLKPILAYLNACNSSVRRAITNLGIDINITEANNIQAKVKTEKLNSSSNIDIQDNCVEREIDDICEDEDRDEISRGETTNANKKLKNIENDLKMPYLSFISTKLDSKSGQIKGLDVTFYMHSIA